MSQGEQQSGVSTGTKVIIGLVAAGVVAIGLCCGGVYLLVNRAIDVTQEFVAEMADAMTNNPAEIQEMTDAMITIDVPAGWQPVMGMQWSFGSQMTMASYSPSGVQSNRTLMLMQMQGPGMNQQQMEQQMQMQMNQQGMNPAAGVQSSETRTFVIDGQERDFLFTVVKDGAGGNMHQVQGVLPGRNGMVMLMFMEDDANWDEVVVEQMIESISTETVAEPVESSADEDEAPAGPAARLDEAAESPAEPVERSVEPAETVTESVEQ